MIELSAADRLALVELAERAIVRRVHGLFRADPSSDNREAVSHPITLETCAGNFVTVRRGDELRGCVGRIQGDEPLYLGVPTNAVRAAFDDPRFGPLAEEELGRMRITVSVLSQLEEVPAGDEAGLIAALRPGIDGLVIALPSARATFLPAVWEQLPEPAEFVRHLKAKAGLSRREWPVEIRAFRYTSQSFGRPRDENQEALPVVDPGR